MLCSKESAMMRLLLAALIATLAGWQGVRANLSIAPDHHDRVVPDRRADRFACAHRRTMLAYMSDNSDVWNGYPGFWALSAKGAH
jgi:hypothetical protein